MVVSKYPATYGHTTVMNNLCHGLNKIGYNTSIGAFSFEKEPPSGIDKVELSKSKLIAVGSKSLGFDIIHCHQPRAAYFLLFKKSLVPFVFHYHGASNKTQELNFKTLMHLHRNKISKIIAVSNTASEQIRKMCGETQVEVIYNGVNTSIHNTRLPRQYKKGEPQLFFAGALREYKKTAMLIDSIPILLKKYPSVHLQIAGEGKEYDKLKKMIKLKNLQEKVELTGNLDENELKLRFSSCDIYVSASTFETLPVSTLEAMACGKPLVLSEHPAHKEVIAASNAGLIFEYSNKSDFCSKITEVFDNKESYGLAARNFAEKHDWSQICSKVANVYNKLLN